MQETTFKSDVGCEHLLQLVVKYGILVIYQFNLTMSVPGNSIAFILIKQLTIQLVATRFPSNISMLCCYGSRTSFTSQNFPGHLIDKSN